jgi:lipoyl synthase
LPLSRPAARPTRRDRQSAHEPPTPPAYDASAKQKSQAKTSRIPIKVVPAEVLKKPEWIRVKAGSPSTRFYEIKQILREHKLHTVCEEAVPEHRRVLRQGHGHLHDHGRQVHAALPLLRRRPRPARPAGRRRAAEPGAHHRGAEAEVRGHHQRRPRRPARRRRGALRRVHPPTRELSPATRIEILVPDFRGRDDRALGILKAAPPDVMNHNLETVPRLYKEARPGSDYAFSLNLLKKFKEQVPGVPTKSGLMVGLGETDDEILQVMRDMRAHGIDMLTIGQYLAPSGHHLPVRRYVHPDTFKMFEREAARWASATPPWARWCAAATTPTSRRTHHQRYSSRSHRA